MKLINRWSMIGFNIFVLFLLMSSVATAQNAVQVPHQSLPSFLGYVEDEFIVVLSPEARRRVTVTQGQGGKPQVNLPSINALTNQYGVQRFQRQFPNAKAQTAISQFVDLTGHYKVLLKPRRDLTQALHAFEANPHVDHVEKIGVHTLSLTPNDPYYENSPNPSFPFDQWHYRAPYGIDASSAWDSETGDSSVLIGMLDSGTRYFHQDLGGNSAPWGPGNPFAGGNIFINSNEIPGNGTDDDMNGFVDDTIGWDFVSNASGFGVTCIDQDCSGSDNDPDDGNGHGTHTSGTVGAITNNNVLVAGIAGGSGAGNGVKIVPLRIGFHAKYRGQTTGVVRMDWAAEAMNYLADLVDAGQNVAAVNCSWGSSNSGGLNAAVDNLLAHDVMVIHAAGNSNSSTADFLGTKAGVMNVAATDRNGNGASFTNHGSWVDVAAPGVDIVSTYRSPSDPDPNNHYIASMSGTSMSAPHICGIAALLESCDASLSQSDKFNLIVNNVNQYFDNRDLGSGIANADWALTAAGCGVVCDIVAGFSATPTSGTASLVVSFTDLSTGNGITSWSWDFGDDNTSTTQNPQHTYIAAGTYTVSLTAFNSDCDKTETKTAFITVSVPPIADFSSDLTSGNEPLTVTFTDLSSGTPTSWLWNFGDGGTSTAQHPSHTYTAVGTYPVALTATNGAGSDTATKVGYITVNEATTPTEMSVFDIVVTKQNLGRGDKQGEAVVTVHDDAGNPVANASVTGVFSGKTSDSRSGDTDGKGQVTFASRVARGGGEWCFEVTAVQDPLTLNYNPSSNTVTKSCESGDVF
jgi:PKD repeat protein